MIRLHDLINLELEGSSVKLDKFNIHCASVSVSKPILQPLQLFYKEEFKEWQEYQHNDYFKSKQIVSLIRLPDGEDRWLFAGLYSVNGMKKQTCRSDCYWFDRCDQQWGGCYQYSTSEVPLEDLTGKVIVKFRKDFRRNYLTGEKYKDRLIVIEIQEKRKTIDEFPGYNSVCLPYSLLCTIIGQGIDSWKTALSKAKGIYLITDTDNGKKYVGKADGENGFWQRWSSYANNGHGEDKELKEIIESKGKKYAENWQFSILQAWVDFNVDANVIDNRETYWKKVLLSKEHGYNKN
jgi:hypothetical protein